MQGCSPATLQGNPWKRIFEQNPSISEILIVSEALLTTGIYCW